jgi:putative ABC transport system permease protein
MTGSALLTLYRSLTRHRLYAVLNIGGLALGLAVFLVLFLYVQYEHGYDRQLPGWRHIWLINTGFNVSGFPNINLSAPAGLLDQLEISYPDITGVHLQEKQDADIRDGTTVTQANVDLVEPGFFKLFPYTAIQGDPATTVAQPDGAVITRKVARQYLGDGSAIGKTLTIAFDGSDHVYRVGAVLADPPTNMTYSSGIYIPLPPPSPALTAAPTVSFLRIPSARQAAQIERDLPALIDRHPPPGFTVDANSKPSDFAKFTFTPLSAVHLIEPRDRTVVVTLGVVGLLTLLIAIVNYINLATARAGLRAREVGLRKVLGATRGALIRQFLGEALASVAIAALIALALAELALPFVNAVGGLSLRIDYLGKKSILLPLIVLIILVGGVAGFYPAFVLSRFRPAAVLASARAPGGGRAGARLRQTLVVLQFAIAIALAIGTAILVAQTEYLRHADLGFRRDGLIMLPQFADPAIDDAQRTNLVRAFATIPGVTSVALSRAAPGGGSFTIANYDKKDGTPPISIEYVETGPDFFTTFHADLLAGRLFDDAHRGDEMPARAAGQYESTPTNVIANLTAIRELGFKSPADAVGKPAQLGDHTHPTIIGVVADMRFDSPRDPIQPIFYAYTSRQIGDMVPTLATSPADVPAVTARLAQIWHRVAPAAPFRSVTVDQQLYEAYYKDDAQRSRLFTIGAVLAVVIGCIGLYGLASFDTARRVKEIGIRKTLGAPTRDIMRLLIGQFLRPVLIANLIAWPLAYVAMRQWLAGFDDRVALSPLYFLAATLIAVAIAAATVFGQAWRVARAEPARALRYE